MEETRLMNLINLWESVNNPDDEIYDIDDFEDLKEMAEWAVDRLMLNVKNNEPTIVFVKRFGRYSMKTVKPNSMSYLKMYSEQRKFLDEIIKFCNSQIEEYEQMYSEDDTEYLFLFDKFLFDDILDYVINKTTISVGDLRKKFNISTNSENEYLSLLFKCGVIGPIVEGKMKVIKTDTELVDNLLLDASVDDDKLDEILLSSLPDDSTEKDIPVESAEVEYEKTEDDSTDSYALKENNHIYDNLYLKSKIIFVNEINSIIDLNIREDFSKSIIKGLLKWEKELKRAFGNENLVTIQLNYDGKYEVREIDLHDENYRKLYDEQFGIITHIIDVFLLKHPSLSLDDIKKEMEEEEINNILYGDYEEELNSIMDSIEKNSLLNRKTSGLESYLEEETHEEEAQEEAHEEEAQAETHEEEAQAETHEEEAEEETHKEEAEEETHEEEAQEETHEEEAEEETHEEEAEEETHEEEAEEETHEEEAEEETHEEKQKPTSGIKYRILKIFGGLKNVLSTVRGSVKLEKDERKVSIIIEDVNRNLYDGSMMRFLTADDVQRIRNNILSSSLDEESRTR